MEKRKKCKKHPRDLTFKGKDFCQYCEGRYTTIRDKNSKLRLQEIKKIGDNTFIHVGEPF